jgi:CRP-like cAMP-binding protein
MQQNGNGELRDALANIPLFAGIPSKQLGDMARSARHVEFPKGQTIFRVGEPARDLFFLLSGQAKRATFSVGGNEKVLELLLPGQSFGEAELFGTQSYASFAVAVEPTVLLCVGGDSVRRTLETEPQLSLRLIGVLAKRAIDVESDAAASQFRTGCQRVLDYLLAQAGPALEPDGQTTLTLTASKQLIASRIGMTPETLSRVLRDLADAGMIVVAGRNIHLQNARITRRMAAAIPEQPVFPRKNRYRDPAAPGAKRHGMPWPGGGALPSLCAAINMAGRQRMLSQRMAKSWLLLGHGIQPGRSRAILAQSAGLFESQMATLAGQSGSDDVRDARTRLDEVWHSYRTLLASEPAPKAARALFELNETVLAAAHDMTLAYEKAADTPQARLVNLAGRQRMLSQRMAKFYLFEQWGVHVARSRLGRAEATREFAAALTELAAAAQGTPQIEAQLELVAQHWQLLQSTLAATDTADGRRQAAIVATASERLLRQADMAVSLYEALAG